jgi:hypothetical protein
MSTLRGTSGDQKGWSRQFDDPIPTGDGELRSLRDAGVYILALPPAEAEAEHWQVAMECLIAAAETGGIVMMAHIAILRAQNHGEPDPAPAPRRKRAKGLQDRKMKTAWAGGWRASSGRGRAADGKGREAGWCPRAAAPD